MSNLIPVQRPDKNGKVVTRHVKAGSTAKEGRSLPAPAVVSAPQESSIETVIGVLYAKLTLEELKELNLDALAEQGPLTKRLVAEALTNCESDEEFAVMQELLRNDRSTGLMQMIAADPKFVIGIQSAYQSSKEDRPYSRAVGVIWSTFSNRFRSRGSRGEDESDYTPYVPRFQASVIARTLDVEDSMGSDFEAADQYQHIIENMDMLIKHLPACRKIISTAMDNYVESLKPSSRTAMELCGIMEDYPGSGDFIADFVEERRRYDASEIRDALDGSAALSRGAL